MGRCQCCRSHSLVFWPLSPLLQNQECCLPSQLFFTHRSSTLIQFPWATRRRKSQQYSRQSKITARKIVHDILRMRGLWKDSIATIAGTECRTYGPFTSQMPNGFATKPRIFLRSNLSANGCKHNFFDYDFPGIFRFTDMLCTMLHSSITLQLCTTLQSFTTLRSYTPPQHTSMLHQRSLRPCQLPMPCTPHHWCIPMLSIHQSLPPMPFTHQSCLATRSCPATPSWCIRLPVA